jgi:hypothetical protein
MIIGCGLFLFSCASHQEMTLNCDGYTGIDYRIYGGCIDAKRSPSDSGEEESDLIVYYFRPANPTGLEKKSYLIDENVSVYVNGFLSVGNISFLKDGLWVEGYFIVANGGDCSDKETSVSVLPQPLLDRIVIPS